MKRCLKPFTDVVKSSEKRTPVSSDRKVRHTDAWIVNQHRMNISGSSLANLNQRSSKSKKIKCKNQSSSRVHV